MANIYYKEPLKQTILPIWCVISIPYIYMNTMFFQYVCRDQQCT